MNEYKSKIINDDEYTPYTIFNDKGEIDPSKPDPSRNIAPKAKLWSKDFESFDIEKQFKDYLYQSCSFADIYLSLFIFEGVVNSLIKRREQYKIFKRKDESSREDDERNTVNNIQSNKKSNSSDDFIIDFDDYYYDDIDEKKINLDVKSSRTRRLMNRKEGKKKDERFWQDTCYKCGEHGNLICCEACEQVAHISCIGLKVIKF
jgi:hypothetical protein